MLSKLPYECSCRVGALAAWVMLSGVCALAGDWVETPLEQVETRDKDRVVGAWAKADGSAKVLLLRVPPLSDETKVINGVAGFVGGLVKGAVYPFSFDAVTVSGLPSFHVSGHKGTRLEPIPHDHYMVLGASASYLMTVSRRDRNVPAADLSHIKIDDQANPHVKDNLKSLETQLTSKLLLFQTLALKMQRRAAKKAAASAPAAQPTEAE